MLKLLKGNSSSGILIFKGQQGISVMTRGSLAPQNAGYGTRTDNGGVKLLAEGLGVIESR